MISILIYKINGGMRIFSFQLENILKNKLRGLVYVLLQVFIWK